MLESGKSNALAVIEEGQLQLAGQQRAANRWLGGPTKLEAERRIDGALHEEHFIRIVDYLRRAYGHAGQVTTMRGSLAWSSNPNTQSLGPFVTFYFTIRDGITEIRAEQRLGNTAGAIYWACRALFKRSVAKHTRRLDEVVTGVVELAESLVDPA